MLELTSSDLEELKKLQLQLLDELQRVCDILGVRFYLDAGTLLGALRHQGFIPWDDDVDVCMIRGDYDRLVQEGSALFETDYFLQTPSNSPQMPASYLKLRLNGTCMVESLLDDVNGNHGIWIDIFPFDFFSSDTDVKKLQKREAFWCKAFDLRQRRKPSDQLPAYKAMARYLTHFVLSLVPAKVFLSRMRMPAPPTVSADGFISCLHYGSCFFWIKWSDAFPPIEVPFEGRKFLALANCEDYLGQVYGNWMKLPPANERVPHHFVSQFDLGKYAY